MSCFLVCLPTASPPLPSPLVLLCVGMAMTLNMPRVPVCLALTHLHVCDCDCVVSLTVRLCKNILLETICHVKNLEAVAPW